MVETHHVVARFSDGAERAFDVREDQAILSAALDADIQLLHQCRAGSCSTCICQSINGTFEMTSTTSIALLPAEIREGKLLACLAHATSDMVIEFAYESEWLERDRPRRYTTKIVEVVRACLSVTVLQLEIDPDEDEPEFAAGMYFLLRVPGTDAWRAFSMVTTVSELPLMGFLVRHVPNGLMTDYVTAHCAPGDSIEIEGPFGEFFLREGLGPLIMVAGGTGLAPILSILDSIREKRRNRSKVLLCFGVTTYDDLFYLEELELRQHLMPRLEIRVSVAHPDERWTGRVGMVTELIEDGDGSEHHVAYVCGPPSMVEAARARLVAAGVPREAVHYERFAASSAAP